VAVDLSPIDRKKDEFDRTTVDQPKIDRPLVDRRGDIHAHTPDAAEGRAC
jgi:hypothetical protein